jgi:hypothetical protein
LPAQCAAGVPGATWRDDLAHRCLKTFQEDGWPVDAYAGKDTDGRGRGADRDHRIGSPAWIGYCNRHTDLSPADPNRHPRPFGHSISINREQADRAEQPDFSWPGKRSASR